ncbi:Sec-independent protein translocase subunit TatA/TatB [Pinibacter aurantiacus]|uniref:Sec-independent protein translocase protein TatA n=1 Tax=Pinibacter aurantiacus TaxID=2851599 RepID=A0A9E2SAG7_9BACT|nr:twin-arginine translocase TatA/TatE family subunit [Pinibacter aurantiacus]MBV4356335.1 twin-arginine translocase TatA/TatE family subunit [Pinibacter aurantiacus]
MSQSLLFIQAPGFTEWIVILVVVVLLFGGKKIPELMRGVGRGLREFNDAKNSVTREIEEGMKDKDNKPASSASTTSNNEQH